MSSGRTTKLIFLFCALLWAGIVLRNVLDRKGTEDFVSTVSQEEVQRFAKTTLNSLQERSFRDDIELCGIIYEDSNGNLGVTGNKDGDVATCDISYFDEPGMAPVASFHTHGKHSLRYDGEAPSLVDMRSDISSQMDGYISTPGGRFWRIDWENAVAVQICGEGCLEQDPTYETCPSYVPADMYTFDGLRDRGKEQPVNC